MEPKPSYYEDIRTLGENLKNQGSSLEDSIKNSVSSYLYNSVSLGQIFYFIERYLKNIHSEIKRLKLLYNYTEKADTKRLNN